MAHTDEAPSSNRPQRRARPSKKQKQPLAVEIGQRLKKARKDATFTLEEVAQAMKCDRQTVASWESGNSYPPIWRLVKLAQIYHVTVQYLACGEPTNEAPSDVIARLPEQVRQRHFMLEGRPKLANLVDVVSRLNDSQLNAILVLAGHE